MLSQLIEFSLKNRVLVLSIIALVAGLGVYSAITLPIDAVPDMTNTQIQVVTEAGCRAMTILSCMSTIMPMSQTTACMPLSLMNDDGFLAFCESDFVVIPSGILLASMSGKPRSRITTS